MKKILVISTTGMGDTLWGTPAIRAIKKTLPALKLHFLLQARWRPLFEDNPHIDRLIDYHPQWYRQPFTAMRLLSQSYDAVLLFHANRDITRFLPWLRRKSLWAHQNAPWIAPANRVRIEGTVHGIRRRLKLIETIGIPGDGGHMEIFFNESDRARINHFLKSARLAPKKFIYLNVGASTAEKRWPEERFFELAQTILKHTEYKIVLGGGPAERNAIHTLLEDMDPKRAAHSLDLPLKTDCQLIGHARLLVTCDTGPMHVGFALKVPTVALFGPYDPRGAGPFELAENSCTLLHPSQNGLQATRIANQGADVKTISVDRVWDRLLKALEDT